MAIRDLAESIEVGTSRQRDRLIAVYIGILAVVLAICSVGGGNATKDATALNYRSLKHLVVLPIQEHPPQRRAPADRRTRAAARNRA
jgi:hypothetical protein